MKPASGTCQWESKSVPIPGIEKCTTPTLDS